VLFSYWLAVLTPLLLGPVLSHQAYSRLYEVEKTRIGLDNAAIALGKGDADWLTHLEEENDAIAGWDRAHHVWHACRFSPVPAQAAYCQAMDRFWEGALLARHQRLWANIQWRWVESRTAARQELRRLEVEPAAIQRAVMPALRPKRCPVCGGVLGWAVERLPSSRLSGGSSPEQTARVALFVTREKGRFIYEVSD